MPTMMRLEIDSDGLVARIEEYFDSRALDSLAEVSRRAPRSARTRARPPGPEARLPRHRHVERTAPRRSRHRRLRRRLGDDQCRRARPARPPRPGPLPPPQHREEPMDRSRRRRRGLDRSLDTIRHPAGHQGGRNGSTTQGRPARRALHGRPRDGRQPHRVIPGRRLPPGLRGAYSRALGDESLSAQPRLARQGAFSWQAHRGWAETSSRAGGGRPGTRPGFR